MHVGQTNNNFMSDAIVNITEAIGVFKFTMDVHSFTPLARRVLDHKLNNSY